MLVLEEEEDKIMLERWAELRLQRPPQSRLKNHSRHRESLGAFKWKRDMIKAVTQKLNLAASMF